MTSEKVKYGLENRELKLSFWEKVQHYGIVGFCFIIPATLTFMYLKDYFENSHKPIKSGEIWFLIIPALLGIIFFYFISCSLFPTKRDQNNLTPEKPRILSKFVIFTKTYLRIPVNHQNCSDTNEEQNLLIQTS